MTAPSSTAAPPDRKRGLVSALVAVAAVTALVMLIWLFGINRLDPYSKTTLSLSGDVQHGGQLFRINCAGCHGIAGQGLVGPSLRGVTTSRSERSIIHQIVSGDTPPMPRFEIEPQGMADLLSHLKTMN